MSDKKISDFDDGGTVQDTDELAASRAGNNVKVVVGTMAAQDADDVDISGGAIAGTTLTSVDIDSVSDAPGARTALAAQEAITGDATGTSNSVDGGTADSAIIGGLANVISAGDQNFIAGGVSNEINGGDQGAVIGGRLNVIAITAGNYNTIQGGDSNTITSTGRYNVILGGYTNEISGSGNDGGSIIGGYSNELSGEYSGIVGGYLCTVSGNKSFMGGGDSNEISQQKSGIIGGDGNVISDTYSFIGGGSGNEISDSFSATIGGSGNTVSGNSSAAIGGSSINISGYASVGIGGQGNITADAATGHGYSYNSTLNCGHAQAGGQFAATGDAQSTSVTLMLQTTTNTPSEMFLNGTSGRLVIPTDSAWCFEALIVARRTDADGESAGYRISGVIDNNAGTVALVGTVAVGTIGEDTSAWDVTAVADNTNKALVINVTGENSKTIRWVAHVRLVQVTG